MFKIVMICWEITDKLSTVKILPVIGYNTINIPDIF